MLPGMANEANIQETLRGRRALVIGAGTPAGRSVALALAAAGAAVACAATSLDGDEVMAVRRTRRAVEAAGRRSAEYAFDLALGANLRVSTRQVAKELGGLDVLVTVASAPLHRPLEKVSDAEWTRALSLGLSGVFYALRAAVAEMKDGGGIICLVSALSTHGAAERAANVAASHGVVGLVRAAAVEYAARGIGVNAIALDEQDDVLDGEARGLGSLAVFLAAPAAAGVSGELFTLHAQPHEG
jgi:NAD(P)-dependent dehydrogenase (short-subunit alcohol dehydrogenase family)